MAVALVVLYHLDLAFPGGFVGVDVFFVISGFVIGQLFVKEVMQTGSFRWQRFMLRRFLRLIPPLAAVSLVVLLVSTLVFSSEQLHETAIGTALSSVLGISNFFIAEISGGYFGLAPATNPLLHTWSLSVEWQFYLFFAAALALLLRFKNRRFRAFRLRLLYLTLTVSVISVFTALVLFPGPRISNFEAFGFYSVLPRMWEFGLGLLLVLLPRAKRNNLLLRKWAGAVGLVMILFAAVLLSEEAQTPGLSTFIPTFGAALVIWSGGSDYPQNPVSRALSVSPLKWVGNLSYSIYLWHWPILFFAKEFGLPNNPQRAIGVVIATLILSLASYQLIERPLSRIGVQQSLKKIGIGFAAAALPIVFSFTWSFSGGMYWQQAEERGWVSALPGSTGHDGFHESVANQFSECEPAHIRENAERWGSFLRCQQSRPGAPQTVAIVGDSHAEHLFPGVASALENENVVYFQFNRFFVNDAAVQVDQIIDHVRTSNSIHTVVVASYWNQTGVPGSRLFKVIDTLAESGKTIVLTNDIPASDEGPESCLKSKHLFSSRVCSFEPISGIEPHYVVTRELMRIAASVPGVTFFDSYRFFCGKSDCTFLTPDGRLGYRDNDHLNLEGSLFLGEKLARIVGSRS